MYMFKKRTAYDKRGGIVSVTVLLASLLIVSQVSAAELFFEPRVSEGGVGQQIELSFYVDTEDTRINALEGRISFPVDILEVSEVRDGNTIMNVWIERPRAEDGGLTEKGEIFFSGITPGGYDGARGLIFSLVFRLKKEGSGTVEIGDASALIHDGKGTAADLTLTPAILMVVHRGSAVLNVLPVMDTEPPESFELSVTHDPELFDGRSFLVFATQDKGSGIDHYEVREGDTEFFVAESPYILRNQDLDTEIVVRALDRAGNAREAALEAMQERRAYRPYWFFGIITMLALSLVTLILLRRFSQRKDVS